VTPARAELPIGSAERIAEGLGSSAENYKNGANAHQSTATSGSPIGNGSPEF